MQSPTYIAVKSDIVKSRSLTDRSSFQRHYEDVVAKLNARYKDAMIAPMTITHGDELQALLHRDAPFWTMACELDEALSPIRSRVGIGVGPLATAIRTDAAIGMDGPAWHFAKEAIDRAHSDRRFLVIASGEPVVDAALNAMVVALSRIRSEWTAAQRRALAAGWPSKTQAAVASELGVTQTNISKLIRRGHLDVYVELLEALQRFVALQPHGHARGI